MPRENVYLMWYHLESIRDIGRMVNDNATILDLGCGEGHVTRRLPVSYEIVAQDITIEPSDQSLANTVHWVEGDAMFLPFKRGSIDGIICHQVIEHVPNQEQLIRELLRVTRSGGIIAISTPVASYLGRLVAPSRNTYGKRVLSPDHLREFRSLNEFLLEMKRIAGNQVKVLKTRKKWVQFAVNRVLGSGLLHDSLVPLPLYYSDVYVVCERMG